MVIKKNTEEELSGDEIVVEDIEDAPSDLVKKLRKKLRVCESEKQEYLEGWQRAKADFVNDRKEDTKRLKSITEHSKIAIISDVINVLDSFDMAFANKEAWNDVSEQWRIGVEHIHNQLVGVLINHGVTEYSPTSEMFDPVQHDSVESVEIADKKKDGKVIEVLQKGYMLGSRNIRPAKVKVGFYKDTS